MRKEKEDSAWGVKVRTPTLAPLKKAQGNVLISNITAMKMTVSNQPFILIHTTRRYFYYLVNIYSASGI